jgi:hypothetical protein
MNFKSPKMNLDYVQVLYGKLVKFPQKTFSHQLAGAKLIKSNTATNTPFSLGLDFTMFIFNLVQGTTELK